MLIGTRAVYIRTTLAALVAAFAWGPAPAATAGDLPDGKSLVDKHFKACGGKAALEGLKNQRQKGTLMLTDMGMEAVYLEYIEPPNQYNESDFQGMGVVKNGFSEGVVWSVNPFTGNTARKSDGSASIDPLLGWEKEYGKAVCVGEETIGETACYKVEVTPSEGSPVALYFDKEAGFLIRIQNANGGATTFGDYKAVGDVMFPHKVKQSGGELNIEIVSDSIEFNVDIPEGQFDLPPEIKAMQEESN